MKFSYRYNSKINVMKNNIIQKKRNHKLKKDNDNIKNNKEKW